MLGVPPPPDDAYERPRAVTVIGWTSLAVAAFLVARALIDLVLWQILRPAMPALLDGSLGGDRAPAYVRPLLEHVAEWKIGQAVFWSGVGACAAGLLRLRPWARTAMRAACWALAAYCVAFAAIWIAAWRRLPADAGRSHWMMWLLAGLCLSFAIAGGLAAVAHVLNSDPVKAAFARDALPPEGPARA